MIMAVYYCFTFIFIVMLSHLWGARHPWVKWISVTIKSVEQSFLIVSFTWLNTIRGREVAWHLQMCISCFLSGERIVAHGLLIIEC